jgi:hypothetical protein
MSDNKLLSENTIRRFMKLANVDSLSDNFLDTLQERGMGYKRADGKHEDDLEEGGMRGKDEDDLEEGEMRGKHEDDLEEGMHGKDEDDLEEGMHGKDEDDLDEAMEDEAEEIDLDDEGGMDDMGAMGDVGEPGKAELAMSDMEAKVIRDLGMRINQIMPDEGGADDMDMDMDVDVPSPDDAAAEMDDAAGGMDAEEKDEIVQEVLRRVTQRIVEAKLRRK